MSSAIPLCVPLWFNNPQGNISQVAINVAQTGQSWLQHGLMIAIDEQDFVTAFSLYAMFYESMLSLIWLCRGKDVPTKSTVGKLAFLAQSAGYIDKPTRITLIKYSNLRNSIVRGDWQHWHDDHTVPGNDVVNARLWAWFYHHDDYLRTTLALYRALPDMTDTSKPLT
jgi:hypothetical protein